MLRQLRYRCWCISASGDVAGPHFRTDQLAYEAAAGDLMTWYRLLASGELSPADFPARDLWQRDQPCWTMRCNGCRELLQDFQGRAHWPSDEAALYRSDGQGWDWELELCGSCSGLVVPLRRRRHALASAPAAG